MSRFQRFLTKLELWLISGPALVALCLVAEQAAARYFYPVALVDWADEIIVYLMMWSVLTSLGQVSARGAHIRTELVLGMLPKNWKRFVEICIAVLAILFMTWLAWYGWRVAHEAFSYDDRTSSSLRFPIWIYYAILPIACIGMASGFVFHLIRIVSDRDTEFSQ